MSSLVELARRLHEERLFIKHEQDTIWKLNKQVQLNAEQLSHTFWVTRQHHLNLNKLITNSAQGTPASCCRRSVLLDTIQFVDAYKELGHQESLYSQFLEDFIKNPTLAAACLAYGDKLGLEATADVARIIVLGCYGNSIMTDDHKHLLELMETLMLLQLAREEQPRRLVQKGSCAFSIVYKLFTESLLIGKLFLTTALYQPVMEVLMDDDLYLETNEQKILTQLTSYEKERRFGKQDSPDFQEKIKAHIKKAKEALSNICLSFINSLLSAMCCFPQSLGWIIARAYYIVKDAGYVSKEEARALCADFFLQQYVCPAIVDPELHGVTGDIPVSDFSRSNLMQIAQVLQAMAHKDESTQQPGSSYPQEAMQSLIDTVINYCNSDTVPNTHSAPHGLGTSAVFFTPQQLSQFIQLLRDIKHSEVRGVDQKQLAEILDHLPEKPPSCMEMAAKRNSVPLNIADDESSQRGNGGGSGNITPAGGSSGDLANMTQHSPQYGKKMFNKTVKVKRTHKREDSFDGNLDESASGDIGTTVCNHTSEANEVVLVISLTSMAGSSQDMPGTLSEGEVMELQSPQNIVNPVSNIVVENTSIDPRSLTGAERLDKRYSLCSGGSDLSETDGDLPTEDGISRTSGSSSIDIGRSESVPVDDTSSFHAVSIRAENQDEDEEEGGDLESVTHANNDEALKDLRSKLPNSVETIEDKMRKFNIRQELGVRFADPGVTGEPRQDDQSGGTALADTRSETWSMDAYASDSEAQTEPDSQSERLREIAEDPAQHIRSVSSNVNSLLLLSRDEDSRSDVWSVEVLPSDSEPPDTRSEDRLQELESETGPPAAEDNLEDNRSRTSTPGLSAASGFSGVSGLSLVSDHNQPKTSSVDNWVCVEQNITKESSNANSASVELATLARTDGASSNNIVDRALPTSSSTSPLPKPLPSGPSPVSMTKTRHDAVENIKISVSFDDKPKIEGEASSRLPRQDYGEKSVAWSVPSSSDASNDKAKSDGLALMDFNENSSTIKRSPYKNRKEVAKMKSSESGSPKPVRIIAWNDKQAPMNAPIPSSANAPNARDSHPSAFARISPRETPSSVLEDFDPLLKVTLDAHQKIASNHISQSSTQTDKQATELTTASLVDISPTHDVDVKAEQASGLPVASFNLANPKERRETSHPEQHKDPTGSPRKGIDRKKSWWKNSPFSTLSKKKVSSKLNGPGYYDAGGSVGSDSPRHSGSFDPYVGSIEASSSGRPAPSKELSNPGEDIMQKYMKLSNQKTAVDGTRVDETDVAQNSRSSTVDSLDAPSSVQNNSSELLSSVDADLPSSSNVKMTSANISSPDEAVTPESPVWQSAARSEPAANVMSASASPLKEFDPSTISDADLKEDAKRKLRIVLSLSEPLPETPSPVFLLLGVSSGQSSFGIAGEGDPHRITGSEKVRSRVQLLSFFRVQLAEARTLQDHSRIAQIHEVMRSIEALDEQGCRHILKGLWRDYKQRSTYVAYLVRARQHLLASSSYLHHLTECTKRDNVICRRYFATQCVRMFLKQKELSINTFRNRFMKSNALDEKVSLVRLFLSWLYGQMVENAIWEGASREQLEEGENCIERYVFTWVHRSAMFPNGDGDFLRDQLFHEHISRLSAVITPAHPSLQVSRKYLLECPWPSAQKEASALAAFRSPRGKLQAALKCCRAVMHLLKLADENQAPGADDFTPVLVFVLIKANPPHLLSTVQYINSFIGEQLSGEDAYWWMQFTAATEFIKTIDERK